MAAAFACAGSIATRTEAPPPPPPPRVAEEPVAHDRAVAEEELTEESLDEQEDDGTDLPASNGADSAASRLADPSPLATIRPDTPPHVAAATRLADQARLRMEGGDADGALELLERAVAVDPTNPYAYYFLARLHLSGEAYQQAINFAERATLLSARAPSGWLSRSYGLQGQILEAAGAFTGARDAYRLALQADPQNPIARAGIARIGGGQGIR